MKIGDMVREYVGGPIMLIVQLLDAGRIALCKVLSSGVVIRVAVVLLTVVGMFVAEASADPPEDAPSHPVIEKTIASATVGASGAIVQPFALEQEEPWAPQIQTSPWRSTTFRDDEVLPFQDRSS
jgi:hypothetical protein